MMFQKKFWWWWSSIRTIPYAAYVLKGLLLVGDETLAATEKEKQLKQLDKSIYFK